MWLLALVIVCLSFLLVARRTDPIYRYTAGLALLGHFFVALVVLPRVPYSWDIAKFHDSALAILGGQVLAYGTTVSSFAAFQSLVYSLAGPDLFALSIINGFLAVLLPLPLRDVMQRLYPKLRTTHLPTILVLFFPLPFVLLTVPMRDALTVLIFATILSLVVRAIDDTTIWPATVSAPLCGMLYLLRPELSLILLVGSGTAIFIFVVNRLVKRHISVSEIFISTTPFAILGFLFFTNRFPLRVLNNKVTYRASGSAVYLDSFQYESWIDVVISAPARAIYFQFAPFPLHVEQLFHLLALLLLPVLIVLTLASIVSIYDCETDRTVLVFLGVVYVAGVVGYGLIDSNFGTTVRHRIPFVLLLVVFASPVLNHWWLRLSRTYNIPN